MQDNSKNAIPSRRRQTSNGSGISFIGAHPSAEGAGAPSRPVAGPTFRLARAGGPLRLDPADIDDAIAILFEQLVVGQNIPIHNSRQARVVDEEGGNPVVAPPGRTPAHLHQRLGRRPLRVQDDIADPAGSEVAGEILAVTLGGIPGGGLMQPGMSWTNQAFREKSKRNGLMIP